MATWLLVFVKEYVKILLLSYTALLTVNDDHAIYIGTVQVIGQPNASQVILQIKVFEDDLANALYTAYESYRSFQFDAGDEQSVALAIDYFSQHLTFSITPNHTLESWALDEVVQTNDIVHLTLQGEGPVVWPRLSVKADFFMELFPAQSNVVQIKYGDFQHYFRLTKSNPTKEIAIPK